MSYRHGDHLDLHSCINTYSIMFILLIDTIAVWTQIEIKAFSFDSQFAFLGYFTYIRP